MSDETYMDIGSNAAYAANGSVGEAADAALSSAAHALSLKLYRERSEQFQLVQMQAYNWGTFSGLHTVDVSPKGMLFIGPSGSGKSTLLDAHAALLTPPNWVNFNVAARESEQRADRTILTYVRGVWGEQTEANGEIADQQLRKGSTCSAISESYRNGLGATVTLIHLYWIRGASNTPKEVGKRYMVADRPFDLKELKFFLESDYDVKRLKRELTGVGVFDAFSDYQERLRSRLGIDTQHALKLLHKTQSAKNLGGLTQFLREFMLDESQAKGIAQELVRQFEKLDSAHSEVVKAEDQTNCLRRARAAHTEIDRLDMEANRLSEVLAGVAAYKDNLTRNLLEDAIVNSETILSGLKALQVERAEAVDRCQTTFVERNAQLSNQGGERLTELETRLASAISQRSERQGRKDLALTASTALGLALPDDAIRFEELRSSLQDEIESAMDSASDDQEQRELGFKEGTFLEKIARVQEELIELERAPTSNIDGGLLSMRRRIAERVGCQLGELPFAGELIEVREQERGWQGAIERVLRGFAMSLLVSERLYPAVSEAVDSMHLGGKLVYIRCLPQQRDDSRFDLRSVAAKVEVADNELQQWIKSELRVRFDVTCVETAAEMRNLASAVTRAGQIQRGRRHHEKDDRTRVDDPRNWVLGANTQAKADRLHADLEELNTSLGKVRARLDELKTAQLVSKQRLLHCQRLTGYSWQDIDVASAVQEVASYEALIRTLVADQNIAALKALVQVAKSALDAANKSLEEQSDKVKKQRWAQEKLEERADTLATMPIISCTPTQNEGIQAVLVQLGRKPTLDSVADDMRHVERSVDGAKADLSRLKTERQRDVVETFREFRRQWEADAEGLDASLESYDDFAAKLRRLEEEDLPSVREKFLALLEEQSNQHSAFLGDRLDSDRREIYDRMDAVNLSLLTAEFNPGRYLKIEVEDRTPPDAKAFREDLAKALAQTLGVGNPASPEERFLALKQIIRRLASQAPQDIHWRDLILDVRLHVEFVAREFEMGTHIEREVYRSGGGKSGGQRQKLTATCLAAALRYQLGGPERALSTYSTVILDEAFDKADADFTEAAIRIFKTFGFQLIVATPVKSVMTIEPYVGGAIYVHIQDGKYSNLIQLPYDEIDGKIDFKAAGLELRANEDA